MRAAHDCQSRHAGTIVRLIPILVAAWMSAGGGVISAENDTAGRADLFESSIRPLLIEHCVRCHGAEKQEGGLRLDTRDAVMNGGDGGPIIIADEPDSSRLIQAVRYVDLEMPPDGQLAPQQIDALTAWVRSGAKWPANTAPLIAPNAAAASRHWAFQPLTGPEPPQPQIADWRRTPIDQFILSRLEQCSLEPSPEADRRTLIRRLTYTLTGLPPTPGEVEAFVRDDASDSYEQLVDRLLDSTHYGEHWGRHWLDVARYSDTKGYVYAREERFWIHAPTYRDWVVQALNNDLPYDRFLLLQLAADQVPDRQPDDLAAMGFLTLGRRFLGVERDIIDDRIDVVCRGAMGLTVSCARCHDHKYDPIPTADYYALYGVFDSCREQPLRLSNEETQPTPEALAELQKRQDALTAELQNVRSEWSDRIRSRVVDYLTAQTELQKYPPKGFDQIFSTD
ncbi:MAG: DUF1549 domain-containing protein, partial [Planctomycetaceae bacterium]|nr:DUF1549 domain-containing protein [Planctomycetaceae bacterium]